MSDYKKRNSLSLSPDIRVTFPKKLWEAANDHQDLIRWSDDGLRVLVNDKRFQSEVSFTYPNLVQIRSFINFRRQLREYNFAWAIGNSNDFEFCHPFFRRDQPELVESILTRRKNKELGIITELYDQENPLKTATKRKRRSAKDDSAKTENSSFSQAKKRYSDNVIVSSVTSSPFITVDDQATTDLDLQSTLERNDQIQTQLDTPPPYYQCGDGDASTQIIGHVDEMRGTPVDSCPQYSHSGSHGCNSYRVNSSSVTGPPPLADITSSYPATIPYYPHENMVPRYPCTQACGMSSMLSKGHWAPYSAPTMNVPALPGMPLPMEHCRPKLSASAAATSTCISPLTTDNHAPSSVSDTGLYDHAFNDEHSRALLNQGYIPVMYTWIPGNSQTHTAGNNGDADVNIGYSTRSQLPIESNDASHAVPTGSSKLHGIDSYCQTSPLILD